MENPFFRVKFWLHAKYSIYKYGRSFRRKTNDQLLSVIEHERGLRAWCSERSYYLYALRQECSRRRLDLLRKLKFERLSDSIG